MGMKPHPSLVPKHCWTGDCQAPVYRYRSFLREDGVVFNTYSCMDHHPVPILRYGFTEVTHA
jgi:hypothetical protein